MSFIIRLQWVEWTNWNYGIKKIRIYKLHILSSYFMLVLAAQTSKSSKSPLGHISSLKLMSTCLPVQPYKSKCNLHKDWIHLQTQKTSTMIFESAWHFIDRLLLLQHNWCHREFCQSQTILTLTRKTSQWHEINAKPIWIIKIYIVTIFDE